MIHPAPQPQRLIVGVFLVLAAVVAAVAPLPILYRSLGVLLMSYAAFAVGGMPFAYLAALLAPPLGLFGGDSDWLIMLPVVLTGNLLAMLGLEYAWRWAALAVSPLLLAAPQVFTLAVSRRDLFAVALPWEPDAELWIVLHVLVALAGVLLAVVLERRRLRHDAPDPTAPNAPGSRRGPQGG